MIDLTEHHDGAASHFGIIAVGQHLLQQRPGVVSSHGDERVQSVEAELGFRVGRGGSLGCGLYSGARHCRIGSRRGHGSRCGSSARTHTCFPGRGRGWRGRLAQITRVGCLTFAHQHGRGIDAQDLGVLDVLRIGKLDDELIDSIDRLPVVAQLVQASRGPVRGIVDKSHAGILYNDGIEVPQRLLPALLQRRLSARPEVLRPGLVL